MSSYTLRRFAPHALAAACFAVFAPACASSQPAPHDPSSVRVENVAVTPSTTTRTTTDANGVAETTKPPASDAAPIAPVTLTPDAQPQPARDAGALTSWPRMNPTASKELGAWMNTYPNSADSLVQWAHDNPTQVETFVTWSLGHRYEDTRAFLLGRSDYVGLERMRNSDPEAVDALLQWSRRSEAAAEALVKHPRGVVWVATNVYGVRSPAASQAQADEAGSTPRAKTQTR